MKLTSIFLYQVYWWVSHWYFCLFFLMDLFFGDLPASSPSPFQQYCQSPWTKGIVTVNHKQVGASGTSRPAFVHHLFGGWKVFSRAPKLFVSLLSDMKIFRDNAKYSPLSPVFSVCWHYLKYSSNSCEKIMVFLLLFKTTWELDLFKKELIYSSHGFQHVQYKMEVSGVVCKPGLSTALWLHI